MLSPFPKSFTSLQASKLRRNSLPTPIPQCLANMPTFPYLITYKSFPSFLLSDPK